MMLRNGCAALMIGSLAIACGGKDNDASSSETGSGGSSGTNSSGGQTGPIVTLDDLLAQLPAVACAWYARCPEYQTLIVRIFGDDCVEALAGVYEAIGKPYNERIAAGAVSFDADAAQRCLELYESVSCAPDGLDTDCESVFVGQLQAGDACFDDIECSPGTYCDQSTSCPGLCVPVVQAGETCTSDLECAGELACSFEGVCAEKLPLGAACVSGLDCSSEYCDSEMDVCAERPPYGVKPLGEQCSGLECQSGLYCDIAGDSICKETLSVGQPCASVAFENPCQAGLYCEASAASNEGVCAPMAAIGESCTDSDGCQAGVCDAGTCQRRERLGEPCMTDERCWGGHCVAGACAPTPWCSDD